MLSRDPSDQELEILTTSWQRLESDYRAEPELALMLLEQGVELTVDQIAPLAAMTVISSTVLNLDETLNLE